MQPDFPAALARRDFHAILNSVKHLEPVLLEYPYTRNVVFKRQAIYCLYVHSRNSPFSYERAQCRGHNPLPVMARG